MTEDDRCLHDSPLFWVPGLGVNTHGPDVLHVWALGPVLSFVAHCFWFLVQSSLYKPNISHIDTSDCLKIGLLRVKNKLMDFYRTKRADPHWRKKRQRGLGADYWDVGETIEPSNVIESGGS